jgi:hypothetical protein
MAADAKIKQSSNLNEKLCNESESAYSQVGELFIYLDPQPALFQTLITLLFLLAQSFCSALNFA